MKREREEKVEYIPAWAIAIRVGWIMAVFVLCWLGVCK